MLNILAIDGGGVRGLLPAMVLSRWEAAIEGGIQNRFGLFAGTSTGAIIAGALASGMSASAIGELFRQRSAEIFAPQRDGILRSALTFKGLIFPAYSSQPLRNALEEHLGDLTLGNCPRPLLLPALDVVSGNPVVFRSGHFKSLADQPEVRLVDAILASAAAPVLFPSVQVGISTYVDGSLWANNPALLAMIEAVHLDNAEPNVLSLGCGRPLWKGGIGFGGLRGLLGWSVPIISLAMDAQSEGINLYLRSLLPRERYLRVDPVLPRHLAPIDRTESIPELIARANDAANEAIPLLSDRFR